MPYPMRGMAVTSSDSTLFFEKKQRKMIFFEKSFNYAKRLRT